MRKNGPSFSYLLSDQEYSSTVHTVFGNHPLGSTLYYQLTDLYFQDQTALCPHLTNIYRKLLLFQKSQILTYVSNHLLHLNRILLKVHINLNRLGFFRAQENRWRQETEIRLTASNFGKVLYTKKEPSESFLKSIYLFFFFLFFLFFF